MDWTNIIDVISTTVLTSGALFGLLKKYPIIGKVALYAEQHAGEIVQEVEKVGRAIVSTPAGAIAAHSLHAEVDRVTDSFKQSEIARLALVGLHSFGGFANSLSDTQRVALEQFIINSVPKDWGIDSKDILTAFADVEQSVAEFSKLGLVQAANTFTEAQKANVVVQAANG